MVDVATKYVKLYAMKKATAEIKKFQGFVKQYGAPKKVLTDNGPAFIAEKWQEYLQENNTKQICTTIYPIIHKVTPLSVTIARFEEFYAYCVNKSTRNGIDI